MLHKLLDFARHSSRVCSAVAALTLVGMKLCPYCEGEVSDTARKCKHCGEWLEPPRESPPVARRSRSLGPQDLFETSDGDPSLGHAANEWVKHHKSMSAIGMVVGGLILVFIFIPMACTMQKKMNEGPSFGGPNLSVDDMPRGFERR